MTMTAPRCIVLDYIDLLVASPKVVTATEAARVQPDRPNRPAHDAFTRLLHCLKPDSDDLWQAVSPFVTRQGGLLILDDSVLDKPYARHLGLVGRFWSGKHKRVVQGIDLLTLLSIAGDALWPCDCRLVNPIDGKTKTKNDHFRDLLAAAKTRSLAPQCVVFDCWYSGKDNLQASRSHGWTFLTQIRSHRRVNLDRQSNRPLSELPIAASGTIVHLEGFGLVQVFRIEATNGHTEYWITNDLSMTEGTRLAYAEQAWGIEEYQCGLKQDCGVERAQVRHPDAQRNHIGCALRAFVCLEYHRFTTGVSWFETKLQIVREAVKIFLSKPLYRLPQMNTA